ncbi:MULTISPECIES: LTA synthase family protein [unclassified Fibrobacter]|uniref:LTA synthase family protein n=1 Tax=unclassified Fibrobacter TaxID=2634177 RepID=UPI000D6AF55B|nr:MULTISPECIES: alkaline phosphatase family protein [unclassified Fibrobacter]PWJ61602.1 phosphoglycerol transferase MdoB-like AlkP superfamily enzyme [Fibrobacter sp. UWR4]PZW74000.1 phosphoglycerol transferase MdoB-like AlkP superfamily enzyme [Fibrobacter sp. UWR1]
MENLFASQKRFKDVFRILSTVLAFWGIHAILRVLLLFRNNPYGIPFVSKPDWYIFHAICIDFIWLAEMALPFALLAFFLSPESKGRRFLGPVFTVLQSILLPFTLLDHEFCRFLGTHFSISLLDTYKDVSSLAMLIDYVAADQSVPYLQWFLCVTMIPAAVLLGKFIFGRFRKRNYRGGLLKVWLIGCVAFFGASELFLKVIWTGGNRMRKLEPVVSIFTRDIQKIITGEGEMDPAYLKAATETARRIWAEVEGDNANLYEYPDDDYPLYRVRKDTTAELSYLPITVDSVSGEIVRPNFLVIFMESHRGMNVGFMNEWKDRKENRPSATPVLDSLSREGMACTKFYTSGIPTVGGVLSTHFGFPPHRFKQTASELTYIDAPSFASILRDAGYKAQFFAAADPAWDNLSVWFQKWYERTHYDRQYEDDSTFFDVTAAFIKDSLAPAAASENKPFIASMITRSNHYPFNLVPGMPDSAKALPQAERMRWTMHWADAQMGRFLNKLSGEPWFKNTYVIVLGDHGFPQGEHGVSAIGSDAYSNVTWIPFVVNGPGLPHRLDTLVTPDGAHGNLIYEAASQSDVAPTILALARVDAPNSFMGHNLFRKGAKYWRGCLREEDGDQWHGSFAIGSHSGKMAMSNDKYRLIADASGESSPMIFLSHDDEENENYFDKGESYRNIATRMMAQLDSILALNDWILVHNRVDRPKE